MREIIAWSMIILCAAMVLYIASVGGEDDEDKANNTR